jgi:hypothetical protein
VSRIEFANIMAFLEAGCGKQLGEESAEVYYSILGWMPIEAIQYAATESLRHNTFPVFPQIGTINDYASWWMRKRNTFDEAERLRREREDNREALRISDRRNIPEELCAKLKQRAIEAELFWPLKRKIR